MGVDDQKLDYCRGCHRERLVLLNMRFSLYQREELLLSSYASLIGKDRSTSEPAPVLFTIRSFAPILFARSRIAECSKGLGWPGWLLSRISFPMPQPSSLTFARKLAWP